MTTGSVVNASGVSATLGTGPQGPTGPAGASGSLGNVQQTGTGSPTISNVLTTQSATGTISAAATPFVNTSGQLQLQITNSGASATISNLSVIFKGEFYD
jgi:hypothetical protein